MKSLAIPLALLALSSLSLAGCGDGGGDADGGANTDAGGTDAGGTDAGGTDAGGTDGGGGGVDITLPVTHTISAGQHFSMIVDGQGALWTFGQAGTGVLGNNQLGKSRGLHGNAFAPIRPDTLRGVVMSQVSAGRFHALAIDSTGGVWAWGQNGSGQLGNGAMGTDSLVPVQVALARPAVAVSAGTSHSLAIDDTGALWAWGAHLYETVGYSEIPIQVQAAAPNAGLRFAQVAAGSQHSLALATDGTLWVWGMGDHELGLGGLLNVAQTPTQVVGENGVGVLSGIVAIAAGQHHSIALDQDGVIWAFGRGYEGQIGDGVGGLVKSPVRVDMSAITGTVTGLRAGYNQSYALLSDGSVFGWGANTYTQLGLPKGPVMVPTALALTGKILDLAVGDRFGLALDDGNAFFSWGQNDGGVQGTGRASASATPTAIFGPKAVQPTKLWLGKEAYSFIQTADRLVWGVGRGFAQSGNILGGGSPVLVEPFASIDVAEIAPGADHTLVLDSAGAVWGMGANGNGQLGDGSITSSTALVATDFSALPAGVTITKVDVGHFFSVALASDGTVWTWGLGRYGQLGDGTDGISTVPSKVRDSLGSGFLGGIVDIAAGHSYIVALDSSSLTWTWGLGSSGQLGATPLDRCSTSNNACNTLPQRVCGVGEDPATCTGTFKYLGPVDAIAAGLTHTLLLSAGQVLAFGSQTVGQVGAGVRSSTGAPIPVNVVNEGNTGPLTGIASIATGDNSSYAVAADGTFYAWGDNVSGQLAKDPRTTSYLTQPTSIPELAALTVVGFAVGSRHAMVLDDTGTIWSWGRNDDGELGHLAKVPSPSGAYVGFIPAPIVLLPR